MLSPVLTEQRSNQNSLVGWKYIYISKARLDYWVEHIQDQAATCVLARVILTDADKK